MTADKRHTFTIIGFDYDAVPDEPVAVDIRRWYDRSTRCYVVMLVDADGMQVDEAIYEPTKAGADSAERTLRSRI